MSNNFAIGLLLIGGAILTMGDVLMKKWASSSSNIYYIIGIIVYVIAIGFLAESFKYKNMAVANAICVGFNIVTLVLISWLYFKEALTMTQLIGVGLILTGIFVIELL